MINKNKFSIKDTKKVLHKIGKQWVVVSAVLLGLAAGGAAVNAHVTHADANTEPARVTMNSKSAKHAYHLPQANRSQTSSLQTQAVNSTVKTVSSLKTKAMATWDNAWDQKVQSTIDQTSNMSAKMDSLSHFSSYIASYEQPLINSYGMIDVYGHMPNGQSNADYNNYAAASNAIVSDATSLANSMITNVEHSMKVANHAKQMANAPVHKQHAQVHAKEVRAAAVSAKSATDQAKHDSAWSVRNGANDPAKRRNEAKAAHTAHMAARAHAYKVANHTAMLKRKASNAMTRKTHAADRAATQSKSASDQSKRDAAMAKSSSDQIQFNAAKSLRAGSNDPAKLWCANASAARSAFAEHKAIRAHNQKVAKHERAMARKAHNDYLRRTGKSKGEIAHRNSQNSRTHRQRIADQQAHKHNLDVRAHAYKVASHTAMLKRKASNAVVRKSNAAKRSAAQSQSAADQAKRDASWAVRNGSNDPAKLAHSNHAKSVSASQALVNKRAASSADQSIAASYANSLSTSVSAANKDKVRVAASDADQKIKDSYVNSVSASVSKTNTSIADYYTKSVNDSVSIADHSTANVAASAADQSLESSIATSYAQSADKSLDDSIAASYATSANQSISASVSTSVARSASASTAKSVASSAANVKNRAEAAVAAGAYDPNKLSAYSMDDLETIGYCNDTQGNEYTIPNILKHSYQMSGNEIFVKIAHTDVTVDTGVYC